MKSGRGPAHTPALCEGSKERRSVPVAPPSCTRAPVDFDRGTFQARYSSVLRINSDCMRVGGNIPALAPCSKQALIAQKYSNYIQTYLGLV
jgi:hypothetical protein